MPQESMACSSGEIVCAPESSTATTCRHYGPGCLVAEQVVYPTNVGMNGHSGIKDASRCGQESDAILEFPRDQDLVTHDAGNYSSILSPRNVGLGGQSTYLHSAVYARATYFEVLLFRLVTELLQDPSCLIS